MKDTTIYKTTNVMETRLRVEKALKTNKDCQAVAEQLKVNINFVYRVRWGLF